MTIWAKSRRFISNTAESFLWACSAIRLWLWVLSSDLVLVWPKLLACEYIRHNWRRGYGEAILHRLESAATELRYSELWLDTLPIQTAAQRLYTKSGYVEFSRIYVRGYQASEAILFRKDIEPSSP